MTIRFFSTKDRPVHMGPYPVERLVRTTKQDLSAVPKIKPVSFANPDAPESLINAMGEYQAMMDAIRDGLVNKAQGVIPSDPQERADHLKAFGYFSDASMVGISRIGPGDMLADPILNPDIGRLAEALKTRQTKTLATGIDVIMADLKDSMEAPPSTIDGHTHAIVFLYENPRAPKEGEAGTTWIKGALKQRAGLLANETACVIANYIRILGWDAKAHSCSSSDVDLNRVTVAAGLATSEKGQLYAPWIGSEFGVAVVTTTLELAADMPLAPVSQQPYWKTNGPAWWFGKGFDKNGFNRDPFKSRRFVDGPHTFEKLKRVDEPTERTCSPVPSSVIWVSTCRMGQRGGTMPAKRHLPLPREELWARLCFCKMVSRTRRGTGRLMLNETLRTSRRRLISLGWTPWEFPVVRNGLGTLTMQPLNL